MGLTRSIGTVTLAAGLVLGPILHAQPRQAQTAAGLDKLKAWLELARHHSPGEVDEAVIQLRRIGVEEHFALEYDLAALIEFIKDPVRKRAYVPGNAYSPEDQERLRKIALKEQGDGTTDSLLRQIALLESDSVMLVGGMRYVILSPYSRIRPDMILELDGVSEQAVATPPNWQIARRAIGGMSPNSATKAWARLWYDATTSYLFVDRVLAVLPRHLAQRQLMFPDDAGAWFDDGCRFEEMAGDRFQRAVEDGKKKRLIIEEQDRKDALAKARRLFEAALVRDPKHPEARLRLARVKLLQGDARAAVRELTALVPEVGTDSVLAYFAYLFLGAAQESARDPAAAMTAYREAMKLYPAAQSPRVSLARLEAPSSVAPAPLEELLHQERRRSDDPWLTYHTGPARRSLSLRAELWRVSNSR